MILMTILAAVWFARSVNFRPALATEEFLHPLVTRRDSKAVVPVFWVTDRVRDASPEVVFRSERDTTLHFGTAQIVIPDGRRLGEGIPEKANLHALQAMAREEFFFRPPHRGGPCSGRPVHLGARLRPVLCQGHRPNHPGRL